MDKITKELAEKSGFGYDDLETDKTMMMIIEGFAKLIRQDEREACAKLAELTCCKCMDTAEAIRARSEK